jgi:peptidyl-prolyl cis-trans isomerase C
MPPMPEDLVAGDAVVVEVAGVKLTEADLRTRMNRVMASPRMRSLPPAQLAQAKKELRNDVTQAFVSQTVLLQEADRLKITAADKDIDEAIAEIKAKIPPDVVLEDVLAEYGMTKESFRKDIATEVIIDKLLKAEMSNVAEASDEEIEEFYNERKSYFDSPETVYARHVLLAFDPDSTDEEKAEKKAPAETCRKELLDGADFAEMAKKYSDCPSKENGGDLGSFTRGKMVKEFEDAAFSQKAKDIGPVVETKFGYHVIEVLKHEPGGPKPIEEVKESIASYLKNAKQQKVVGDYVEGLRSKAKITGLDNAGTGSETPQPMESRP